MSAGAIGFLLAAVGMTVGLFGGAAGTYFAIKHAPSPAERRLVQYVAVVIWLAVLSVTVAVIVVPRPYPAILLLVFGVSLPIALSYVKSYREKIRKEQDAAGLR